MESYEYDVVIYGTGLVNCLVGSILTKRNLKVLQVDKNSEYGNNYRTLSFKQLLELKNTVSLTQPPKDETEPPEGGHDGEREADSAKDGANGNDGVLPHNVSIATDSSLSTYRTSSTLMNLNSDLEKELEEPTEPVKETSTLDQTPVPEKREPEEGLIYYEVNPFGENKEQVLSSLLSQSNSFNIDLWPRFLLNSSKFTEFLVHTNLHKQLQLCTNNETNICFAEQEAIVPESKASDPDLTKEMSDSTDVDEIQDEPDKKDHTSDKAGTATTTSNNDEGVGGKDGKKEERKEKGPRSSFLHELVYDKNSIFRSTYLDLKEKRILNKFLFNAYNTMREEEKDRERKAKNEEGELVVEQPEEVKDQPGTTDSTAYNGADRGKGGKRKDKKENKGRGGKGKEEPPQEEEEEDWVEYLKKNNLNDRMINVINCMCLELEPVGTKREGIERLLNYIRTFDNPGHTNKNCLIYCLYGTNNLVQHVCRLSSLNNCHLMLNNAIRNITLNSRGRDLTRAEVSVPENSKLESAPGELDTLNTATVEGAGAGGNGGDNSGTDSTAALGSDNNADSGWEGEDAGAGEMQEGSSNASKEEQVKQGTSGEERDDKLTNMFGSGDQEEERHDEEFDKNILLSLDGYKIYTDYLISEYPVDALVGENELVGKTFQHCSPVVDKKGDEKRLLVLSVISDWKVLEDLNGCVVLGPVDPGTDGKRNDLTFVYQTCKDSQSAPENMYVIYFMKLTTDASVNFDVKKVDGVYEENDVYRMLNLYKKFTGDLSHILFLSYTFFKTNNNVNFVSQHFKHSDKARDATTADGRLSDGGSNDSRRGSGEKERKEGRLVVHDNEYRNEHLLVFMDELRQSQKIANAFLRMYDGLEEGPGTADGGSGKEEEEKVDFERYLKCNIQEEDEAMEINCDFLTDFITKFF